MDAPLVVDGVSGEQMAVPALERPGAMAYCVTSPDMPM